MAGFKIKPDLKEFEKFAKFGKTKGVGIIKRSIRATVNDQAWATRKKAQKIEIPAAMETRTRWNQSLVIVTTAKKRSLTSEVGAINKANYFGLRNIELGKKERNPAIPLLNEVRGGSRSKKITPKKQISSYGKVAKIRSKTQLRKLGNSGYTGYFEMKNNSTKLRMGIYKYRGKGKRVNGLLRRNIEKFRDTEHKATKPRKVQWLKRSSMRGASAGVTSLFWRRNQIKFLEKAMNKRFK